MSLRRPTVALLLFTFDISPFRDVAQTSDCGTHCRLYSIISPLCGVALTPDCGIVILAFSSRGVIQTLVWHQYYYSCSFLSRSHSDTRLAPVLLFCSFRSRRHSDPRLAPSIYLCLIALVNLFMCFMFTFVIPYVRTVLRVLS